MQYINLTQHTITDVMTGKTYEPSGIEARASTKATLLNEIDGTKIYAYKQVDIESLPEPKPNTMYIVSNMALNAVPEHRIDVVAPGPAKRSVRGSVIGCRGFQQKHNKIA